jgi:SAM-dependent methyltransferase
MDTIAIQAQFYDWEARQFLRRQLGDVAFYDRLARACGTPVLELGCGTGRVTKGLSERGHSVVGLDINPHSLAIARSKLAEDIARGQVRLVEGDMCRFDLGMTFQLVIVPYNSFQCLLDPGSQRSALAAIRRHLAPGGRLALELTPFQKNTQPSEAWDLLAVDFLDAEGTGDVVAMYERVEQDWVNQLTHFHQRHEILRPGQGGAREVHSSTLTLRTIYRFEAELLFELCRFSVAELFGSYDCGTYDAPDAYAMLFVLELAQ